MLSTPVMRSVSESWTKQISNTFIVLYTACVPDFKTLKCVFSKIRSRFIKDWRNRIHLKGTGKL